MESQSEDEHSKGGSECSEQSILADVELGDTWVSGWYHWNGESYKLVHNTEDAAAAVELVCLRAAYCRSLGLTNPSEPFAFSVEYLRDVADFIMELQREYPGMYKVEYARWYMSQDFPQTYQVLVTRAACEAVLQKVPECSFDRFEFEGRVWCS